MEPITPIGEKAAMQLAIACTYKDEPSGMEARRWIMRRMALLEAVCKVAIKVRDCADIDVGRFGIEVPPGLAFELAEAIRALDAADGTTGDK